MCFNVQKARVNMPQDHLELVSFTDICLLCFWYLKKEIFFSFWCVNCSWPFLVKRSSSKLIVILQKQQFCAAFRSLRHFSKVKIISTNHFIFDAQLGSKYKNIGSSKTFEFCLVWQKCQLLGYGRHSSRCHKQI